MTKLPWYLRLGCTLVLQERWRAADTLRLVSEHRMPSIGGVAAQIALLLRVPDFDTYDLSSVQTIVIGGGPSPPEIVREARRPVRRRVLDPLLVDRVRRRRHRDRVRRDRTRRRCTPSDVHGPASTCASTRRPASCTCARRR